MADNNKSLSEQEIIAWSRESYQKATAFLAQKGMVAETVSMQHSRYLAPLVAVWKIKTTENKWLWVLSGDLPTDFITESGATTAREAMKSFSFKWQMDSEKILAANDFGADKEEFAKVLRHRAERLYDISEAEQLWSNSQ